MSTMQAYQQPNGTMQRASEVLENVLIQGDLSHLDADGRIAYYQRVCQSLGLNPLTKPFEYLELDKKLVLYAKRDCTDQLRKLHGVSVEIVDRKVEDGVIIVTARAKTADGREDESIGVVCLEKETGEWKTASNGKKYFQGSGEFLPIRGEALANAMMKAETKAKRRVTLSICGLGFSDESEMEQFTATAPSVSQPAPRQIEPPKPGPTLDECRRWLRDAADLVALQSAWSETPGQFKPDLVADKDARKAALMAKAVPPVQQAPAMADDAAVMAINGATYEIGIHFSDAVEKFGLECGIPLRDGLTPQELTATQAAALLAKLKGGA